MTDETYDVPTKDQLMALAKRIDDADENLIESDFYDYSEEINSRLLALREGLSLSEEVSTELANLYDAWESEGFPIPDDDYDAIQEGGPSEEEDPDAYPDPADAPASK